jgi:hypothetical protein
VKNLPSTIILIPMLSLLAACTFNVSMSHTSGGSTDTMDDTQSNQPVVSPTVSLPSIPGLGSK